MKALIGRSARLLFLTFVFITTSAIAEAQTSDSGSVSIQGTVSGYVEVRAGGAATLANNRGGGITNNKIKGDKLNTPTTMTIDFGEVGPSNSASFVTATVPLRLRGNVSYTLKASAAAMTYGSGTPDASSVMEAGWQPGLIPSRRARTATQPREATDQLVAQAEGTYITPGIH